MKVIRYKNQKLCTDGFYVEGVQRISKRCPVQNLHQRGYTFNDMNKHTYTVITVLFRPYNNR